MARLMAEHGYITPKKELAETTAKTTEIPRPVLTNANLDPRTAPLSRREAAHLLRRAQFGAAPVRLTELIGVPANEAVELLFQETVAAPKPPEPDWASMPPVDWRSPVDEQLAFIENNFRWFEDLRVTLFQEMQQHGLREKMALFWQNLLVTDYDTHGISAVAYRYVALLRDNGLGNFKDLIRALGQDMAMLFYLDGFVNQAGNPNENYARHLLESFTMGLTDKNGSPNFTENDVADIARAFTGWTVDLDSLSVVFNEDLFDGDGKTIFGQIGSWGYDQVIDIIFQQKSIQIADYICTKLYQEFVYQAPNGEVINQMADVFINSDFDIRAVMQALLSSEHFYTTEVMGGRFKSPAELYIGMITEAGVDTSTDAVFLDMVYGVKATGQDLINPPNVNGYPGYRSWLNTASIASRIQYISFFMSSFYISDDALLTLVNNIHDSSDPHAAFKLALALAEHFSPVPTEELYIEPVSGEFFGDAQPVPAVYENGPAYVLDLTKRLLEGTPWYEWDLNLTGALDRIRRVIIYLHELPEIHLN